MAKLFMVPATPAAPVVYDHSMEMDEGIPLILDEEEESTVAIPTETNKQVVDGRLR